jgi:hypothetical protein
LGFTEALEYRRGDRLPEGGDVSEYGEGHPWSLEKFGKGGPALRRLAAQLAHAVHTHFADLQESAESSEIVKVETNDVYGRLWRPLFDTFAERIPACIPNAYAWKPAGSKYRVVKVNNWLVFPFRCDHRTPDGFHLGKISPLRRRMLSGAVLHEEDPTLPLDLGPAEPPAELITAEDEELIERFLGLRSAAEESVGVVAVIMSSNPHGIQTLEWGEVDLRNDEVLTFTGFHEDLMWAIRGDGGGGQMWPRAVVGGGPVGPSRLGVGDSPDGFAGGEPAEPPMQIRGREDSQPGHEPPAEGEDASQPRDQGEKGGSGE